MYRPSLLTGLIGALTLSLAVLPADALAENNCGMLDPTVADLGSVVTMKPSPGSSALQTLTSSNWNDVVMKSDQPVLVDVWASWCGPCRSQMPIVEKVAESMKGQAVVGKLDFDANSSLARQLGVSSLPTLLVIKDGKIVARYTGLTSQQTLEGALRQHMDSVVETQPEVTVPETTVPETTEPVVDPTTEGDAVEQQTTTGDDATAETGTGTDTVTDTVTDPGTNTVADPVTDADGGATDDATGGTGATTDDAATGTNTDGGTGGGTGGAGSGSISQTLATLFQQLFGGTGGTTGGTTDGGTDSGTTDGGTTGATGTVDGGTDQTPEFTGFTGPDDPRRFMPRGDGRRLGDGAGGGLFRDREGGERQVPTRGSRFGGGPLPGGGDGAQTATETEAEGSDSGE